MSRRFGLQYDHDSVLLTVLNVPLTVPASLPTIATMATTIKPNITAYSTAVGPSSLTTNRRTVEIKFAMFLLLVKFLNSLVHPLVDTLHRRDEGCGNLRLPTPAWELPLDRRVASPGSFQS
jgi:hypothetical protein